jgi:hypothetical protein
MRQNRLEILPLDAQLFCCLHLYSSYEFATCNLTLMRTIRRVVLQWFDVNCILISYTFCRTHVHLLRRIWFTWLTILCNNPRYPRAGYKFSQQKISSRTESIEAILFVVIRHSFTSAFVRGLGRARRPTLIVRRVLNRSATHTLIRICHGYSSNCILTDPVSAVGSEQTSDACKQLLWTHRLTTMYSTTITSPRFIGVVSRATVYRHYWCEFTIQSPCTVRQLRDTI